MTRLGSTRRRHRDSRCGQVSVNQPSSLEESLLQDKKGREPEILYPPCPGPEETGIVLSSREK
ncbi:hypothetical protein AN958_02524 [Leucoagaricus sp. SymC.cos]|nr:hypothetical protein AN958_02524 [Leucoagaricus sp. SymC.cos]